MATTKKTEPESKATEIKKEVCGLIMPISGNDGYTAAHWAEVKLILEEVIEDAGFTPNLVSDAEEIGIIHNRIVNNIINNPIVVCDVSSKNPNVMFELGLRLAFDKATIIVKDDATNYNFDTGVIEHLGYPRDLRYSSIIGFKQKLKEKLTSTYAASQDPKYSTFLKSFVQYKPKIETQEIGPQEFVLKQLENINKQLAQLQSKSTFSDPNIKPQGKLISASHVKEELDILIRRMQELEIKGDFSDRSYLKTILMRTLSNKGYTEGFSKNDMDILYSIVDYVIASYLQEKDGHGGS